MTRKASSGGGGDDFTLRVLESVREVPAATWDAMVGPEGSPFVEHEWLLALEETGCVGPEPGWLPTHLTLWQGDALLAAAPAYAKGNSEGEFVFDWAWAEAAHRMGLEYYPKIVVAVPFTPATGDRVLVAPGGDRERLTHVLATAAREFCLRAGGSGVHVLFPRDAEADAWEAAGYLRRDGAQYHFWRDGAKTFDDYLGRFDSKGRNQMKREMRRVAELGIRVETLPPEGHTREVARAMYGFYASMVDRHGPWGRHYLSEPFFERVAERFAHRLCWVLARDSGGRPIGGAFNAWKGSRMYGRYWGASVEVPNLHFVLCYYEGIRHCIERGLEVFEGGAGRDEHKRSRGFVATATRSAHWIKDDRLRRALGPWLEHERARVRALLTEP